MPTRASCKVEGEGKLQKPRFFVPKQPYRKFHGTVFYGKQEMHLINNEVGRLERRQGAIAEDRSLDGGWAFPAGRGQHPAQ